MLPALSRVLFSCTGAVKDQLGQTFIVSTRNDHLLTLATCQLGTLHLSALLAPSPVSAEVRLARDDTPQASLTLSLGETLFPVKCGEATPERREKHMLLRDVFHYRSWSKEGSFSPGLKISPGAGASNFEG